MSRLSGCIFEWDSADYQLLLQAKKSEMVKAGIPSPSDRAVSKAVTKEELAHHCRRRTRGTEETTAKIESLFLVLSGTIDVFGDPLLRSEMTDIWEEQKRHIKCIQDPPGIPLYTITGHLNKGGVQLPVFRCARGTTSLESYHLHLANSSLEHQLVQ